MITEGNETENDMYSITPLKWLSGKGKNDKVGEQIGGFHGWSMGWEGQR